jgi:hypothetical protein
VARMLRFMHAKNVHSDTLREGPSWEGDHSALRIRSEVAR